MIQERLVALMSGFFGVLAMLLAALGIALSLWAAKLARLNPTTALRT
jgi:hypothetical protein